MMRTSLFIILIFVKVLDGTKICEIKLGNRLDLDLNPLASDTYYTAEFPNKPDTYLYYNFCNNPTRFCDNNDTFAAIFIKKSCSTVTGNGFDVSLLNET